MRVREDASALVAWYERVLWRLVVGANIFGVAITLVYAFFFIEVYPGIAEQRPFGPIVTLGIPMVVLAAVSGRLFLKERIRVATHWLAEDRTPSADEHRALFSVPAKAATVAWAFWPPAIAIGGILTRIAAPNDLGLAPVIRGVLGVLLISVVAWALSYLLVERALGEAFARAASDERALPRSMSLSTRLALAWFCTSGVPIAGIALVLVAQDQAHAARAVPVVLVICSVSSIAGIAVALFSGISITSPLARVRSALADVGLGNFDLHIPARDTAELGELEVGVNRMVQGLRERERMRELFGHHVGADVAERAIAEGADFDGALVEATALFVDVIASSALAEQQPPREVVGLLNGFFDAVVRCVAAEGGYVSKFEGDGALCIFGAPIEQPDHADRALRAARALRTELRSMSEEVDAAIGVSSGELVAGNIGSADRYEYTIIGDAVNEAARLTDEAKYRHTRVLVSARTLERAGSEASDWSHSGTISLRGRATPTVAFEPGEGIQGAPEG